MATQAEMPVDRHSEELLELDDIQGDILVGLQKDAELFIGFAIDDVARFKRFLAGLKVTSCLDAKRAEAEIAHLKATGSHERLDIRGINIGFTFAGLEKLGAPMLDGIFDEAFTQGLAARSADLNDPVEGPGALANWLVGNGVGPLDGMLLLTAKNLPTVRAMIAGLNADAGPGTWLPYFNGEGWTRPNQKRGHEHFGFLDGVSQPAIRGRIGHLVPGQEFLDPTLGDEPGQGLPGADLHWPGAFVFGYASQREDDVDVAGPPADGGADWMRNGSYMVYRRLEQLVPEFHAKVAHEAAASGLTPNEMGGRIVGRFQSGWPISRPALSGDGPDDLANAKDPMQNNKFEFGDDPTGKICPFAAHIRKTYPRDDPAPGGEAATQTHRIKRAGIPFGIEVQPEEHASGVTHHSRGLMFVCYQTSIRDQFEFMTSTWVNNAGFLVAGTGEDPVIGQAPGDHRTRTVAGLDPNHADRTIAFEADFVRPTGGGYFFMPSLGAIATILSR